jgi:hypothetical protein
MDKPINIEKISDLNELNAEDIYTQVNFKSYSYIFLHHNVSVKLFPFERFKIVKKNLSRTISYVSSDYILIQGSTILLNVEFEK